MWFQHQRESVVSQAFRKGAVNRYRLPAPFQRRFAFFDLNRDVPVDDQSLCRVDAELGENLFTKPRLVDQAEIRVLRFEMGALVSDQTAFKSRDAIFAEQRGFRAAPEIPE